MPPKYHGFMLIELLVVIVLITILASISVPYFTNHTKHDLTAVLHELEELCLCAQYTALATNKEQCIVIDPASNSCTLQTSNPQWSVTLPANFTFGWLENIKGPPGDPRHQITQAVTFPFVNKQFCIFFQQNGVISPGTAYIIDRQRTSIGAFTCSVSGVSYIRKYLYTNDQWGCIAS